MEQRHLMNTDDTTLLFNNIPTGGSYSKQERNHDMLENCSPSKLYILKDTKVNYPYEVLSMRCDFLRKHRNTNRKEQGKSLPWFDFSAVDNPSKTCLARIPVGFPVDFHVESHSSQTNGMSRRHANQECGTDRFDVNPLRLIDFLPDLSQILHIAGYPSGGDTICITRGIVSRIDVTNYKHSIINIQLPTLQVDAAINSGNSGGPVFVGNVVVGVGFQTLRGKENIGYVIPAPIVNRFVSQVEAGEQETGFCCLGVHLQAMDNLFMREFFSMTESMSGVFVTGEMEPGSAHPLALYDIILEIDGLHI